MILAKNKLYVQDLAQIIKNLDIPDYSCVLITGASGLIGSCVTDSLIYYNEIKHRKLQIYIMGRQLTKMKHRFAYAKDNPHLHMIEQDVCMPLSNDREYDYIIHAASNADPESYARYPSETIATNVLGTLNILNYARFHKSVKVLFTSSMEVYGNIPNRNDFLEEDYGIINYNEIRAGYPESKRTAELLVRSFIAEYGINAVIVRLGYIYGPTMTATDNKVVAQFIRKAIANENIILKSKGYQRRSYCYVADAVSGIFIALLKGKIGETYNIANKYSVITIADLAQITADLIGKKVIFDLPSELEKQGFGKTQDAVLNTDKLEALGYVPIYSLKTGLKRTITILQSLTNN